VLLDIGGTLVAEAPPGTPTSELRVTLLSGALDDLRTLAAGVRVGAVTNTGVMTEADVRALLAPTGLDDLLEVLVTSVDAGAWKPDPRPLMLALDRLGLTDAARVLYVGNEPTDAAAARAAGMGYVDVGGGGVLAAVRRWLEG